MRDVVIFFMGAQVFHTLSHIVMAVSNTLPLQIFSFTIDQQVNAIIVVINLVILAFLFCYLFKK